jgi:hypothetical protein
MNFEHEVKSLLTRRQFFGRTATGIGALALTSLFNTRLFAGDGPAVSGTDGVLPALDFAPKAKRVIYLFMSGGPSHIDLFDPKPKLAELHGQELPASVRGMQRVTLMTRKLESGGYVRRTADPSAIPVVDVLRHGLRHLAMLRVSDPTIAQTLSGSWHELLAGWNPLPAGLIEHCVPTMSRS